MVGTIVQSRNVLAVTNLNLKNNDPCPIFSLGMYGYGMVVHEKNVLKIFQNFTFLAQTHPSFAQT